MRVKLNLVTRKDISEFLEAIHQIDKEVYLVSGNGNLKVSGHSLLGALYTLEWNDVYCVCEKDIYSSIKKFVVE